MKRLNTLLFMGLFATFGAVAQTELLPNGGFEKLIRDYSGNSIPEGGWTFQYPQSVLSDDAHSGEKAIRLNVAKGDLMSLKTPNFETLWVDIVPGETYIVSFWYKGVMADSDKAFNLSDNITFSFGCRAMDGSDADEIEVGQDIVKPAVEWQKFTKEITVPTNVNGLSPVIDVNKHADQAGFILIDDLSLIAKNASGQPLVAPSKPVCKRYQREALITWEDANAPGITYEVEYNGNTAKTKDKFLVIRNLSDEDEFLVKIRVRGHGTVKTSKAGMMEMQEYEYRAPSEEVRTPYLWTTEGGVVPRKLGMFFMDLRNPDAKITCIYKGQSLPIEEGYVTLPDTGEVDLKVVVDEGNKRFDLYYHLTVKDK